MQITQNAPDRPDRAYLDRLLSDRNRQPARAEEIDREVWRAFGRKVAILALDMCGFSRLAAQFGIVHFMAMIHRMETAAGPAVTGNGGQVVKVEADNLFAVFTEPKQALEAALDTFRAFAAMNAVVPESHHVRGSIGIGYGDVLIVGDEDLFGHEMNLACKLGEDLAGADEILLTAAAYEALPEGRYGCAEAAFAVSGLELRCHRFERCLYPRPGEKT